MQNLLKTLKILWCINGAVDCIVNVADGFKCLYFGINGNKNESITFYVDIFSSYSFSVFHSAWKELSNGVWIIQIGRKTKNSDIQKIKGPLRPRGNIAKRRKRSVMSKNENLDINLLNEKAYLDSKYDEKTSLIWISVTQQSQSRKKLHQTICSV